MRVLVQRVSWAEVEVEVPGAGGTPATRKVVGRIGPGLLVYVGIGTQDTPEQAAWLAEKVANLRIFEDEQGKLNRSVQDARGEVLAISNFTLLGDARKGRRPEFTSAAKFDQARPIHEAFLAELRRQGLTVATGVFGAAMTIRSQAEGPVNIVVDSP